MSRGRIQYQKGMGRCDRTRCKQVQVAAVAYVVMREETRGAFEVYEMELVESEALLFIESG